MLSFCRKDRVDRRHHAISGLSMILNDTIKRGRNSHFIWTRKHTEMMTSQRLDTQTQWREPAGELKINAESQRVPLLGGRDVPAYCRWGSPPAAGCGLVWVGSFQTRIKYLMVSTVGPSWSWWTKRSSMSKSVKPTWPHPLMSLPWSGPLIMITSGYMSHYLILHVNLQLWMSLVAETRLIFSKCGRSLFSPKPGKNSWWCCHTPHKPVEAGQCRPRRQPKGKKSKIYKPAGNTTTETKPLGKLGQWRRGWNKVSTR